MSNWLREGNSDLVSVLFGVLFLFGISAFGLLGSRALLRTQPVAIILLGAFVVGTAAAISISVLLGLIGLFDAVGLGACGVVLAGAAAVLAWMEPATRDGLREGCSRLNFTKFRKPLGTREKLKWVFATVAIASVGVAWVAVTSDSLAFGINRQDSLWYHLPLAAGMAQTGEIGPVQQTDPLAVIPWFFPQNGEVLHAVGMVFLGSDFLSIFLNLLLAGVLLLASWGIGSLFGNRLLPVLTTAYLLATPLLLTQAGTASNDLAGAVFLVASIVMFLLALKGGTGRTYFDNRTILGTWFLSGLAAGLAVGTKLPLLVPVGILFLGVLVSEVRQRRVRAAVIWMAAVLLGGGFWYLRNLFVAGNPLPWVRLGPFEELPRTEEFPREPFSIGDYLGDPETVVDVFPSQLELALGPLWPIVLLGGVIGLVLALLWRNETSRSFGRGSPWVALAMLVLLIFHIFFIPVSASGDFGDPQGLASNLRYVAPALLLGLIFLVVWIARRWPRSGLPMAGALSAATLATLAIDLPSSEGLLTLLIPIALLASLLAMAVVLKASRPQRLILVGAGLVGAFALFMSAEAWYSSETSSAPVESNAQALPPFVLAEQWQALKQWAAELPPTSIGISGPAAAFGQHDLVGRTLKHEVSYVGTTTGNGGLRPAESCDRWVREVNRRGSQFLVIASGPEFFGKFESREALWTRLDPAALEIGRGGSLSVFLIRNSLNPKACRQIRGLRTEETGWGGQSPIPLPLLRELPVNILEPDS